MEGMFPGSAFLYWLPVIAFVCDALFADPKRLPHPVQAIGAFADFLEKFARALPHPRVAGVVAVSTILILTGSAVLMLVILPYGFGVAFTLYLAWAGLALGSLVREGNKALTLIETAEKKAAAQRIPIREDVETVASQALTEARHAVQMLVSRETSHMEIRDLYRSLAESLSENFNDAFTAPFFWLCLTGPIGLWMYKAASTLDSMWGYTTPRWKELGWCAARLDDALAFIPARLSAWLMLGAAFLERRFLSEPSRASKKGKALVNAIARDAKKSASPNAGWPMAAAAWLFNGKTGGPTPYNGNIVEKPAMGPENGCWNKENTLALIRHIRRAGALLCALYMLYLITTLIA